MTRPSARSRRRGRPRPGHKLIVLSEQAKELLRRDQLEGEDERIVQALAAKGSAKS